MIQQINMSIVLALGNKPKVLMRFLALCFVSVRNYDKLHFLSTRYAGGMRLISNNIFWGLHHA